MDGPGHCGSQDQIPGLKAAADLLKPEYHGRVAYHCFYYSWDPICLGGVQPDSEDFDHGSIKTFDMRA
jgi:hypothetical protein